jgi:predicted metal-dependent enzyme (double-stranded beta helix superfamily)
MKKTLICFLAGLATPALGQGTAPLIDNARVTVRDVALQPGTAGPAISHSGDYVILYFQGGRIRAADGKTATHPSGGAIFGHGGSTSDTALDKPVREIVVELKDSPSNTVPNTTGLPPAFPREGSKLILENDRIRVWNYAWVPGKPTPMHFHNTEVVVAYRGDGDVSSTTPDGKTTVNHRKAGDIVFNVANRSHSEALVQGEQSGIMLELK